MVYRGKPSAGCVNCRKAKKRCGLERPACQRCVKLGKECSGYRDTTSLQIQDETISVTRKAERQKHGTQRQTLAPPTETVFGILTPGSTSDSSSSSDSTIELETDDESLYSLPADPIFSGLDMAMGNVIRPLKPKADDIATNFFYNKFTSHNGHWQFMRNLFSTKMDPCLQLAIKACGMAALDNQQNVVMGREYARGMYVEALGLLNARLRDPKQSKTDASLVAVSMLGYYENLTCEGSESIQSWKSHIRGATQLLKLRGKNQFGTSIGRLLFRQIRAQILIQCIWDDEKPPSFLWELQPILESYRDGNDLVKPVDKLTRICLDFAHMRARLCKGETSDQVAAEQASELERRFIQWQIDATTDERWRYHEIEVPDSEHVWDGKVHSYATGHPTPTAWITWRCMRIMLSRTQEWLCRRFSFSESEREEQMLYFRKTRRQMTDDICMTIPVQLGHAKPAYSSECPLVTSYSSIWPIFFAGTCCLERAGTDASLVLNGEARRMGKTTSAAPAQASWLLDRLAYISEYVGLRWADGVAATLRGDFQNFAKQFAGRAIGTHPEQFSSFRKENDSDIMKNDVPRFEPWRINENGLSDFGPQFMHEKPSLFGETLTEDIAQNVMRDWLGREVDPIHFNPPP